MMYESALQFQQCRCIPHWSHNSLLAEVERGRSEHKNNTTAAVGPNQTLNCVKGDCM